MATLLQFPARPGHVINSELFPPPTHPGIPWMVGWEPPRFRVAAPVTSTQQTEMWTPTPDTLPPQIAGSSYNFRWEPPIFRGVPSERQQTEMRVITSETLPPIVAGMWWKPWEPPRFRGVPVERQQTEIRTITSSILPPIIAGMWWKGWEPPYFPKKIKTYLQSQTNMHVIDPSLLPAPVSGISWMKGWEPPYFHGVDPKFPPQMWGVLIAGTLPPRPVNPGYRLPLFTKSANRYPSNFWKGENPDT